jgi:tetratricopeptide (TPR) repeat protein/tRNA A-37 threonylcarbamoyl transferase component Bud32
LPIDFFQDNRFSLPWVRERWAGESSEDSFPATSASAEDPFALRQTLPEEDSPTIPGYAILEELGRGGQGVVYKARQADLNRFVVLKMIRPGELAHPRELARFQAEARAVARLQHPNVVQIYEVGEVAGRPYLTLEYVEGWSLDRLLHGKPWLVRPAAELLQTLAHAVHYAHQCGIVHRDLKPGNVLIRNDGVVKVTDFGLARRLPKEDAPNPNPPKQTAEADRLTQSGAAVGTPSYMPPEQACGRSRDVGPLADVYALGAILYECLTGRPPFLAASWVETLHQVRFQDPVPPRHLQPRVPRDLETICLKCLEKEPGRRYASAADLADDLRRFLDGKPIVARAAPPWERAGKWVRRHPVGAFALLTATALVALGAWHVGTLQRLNEDLGRQTAAAREQRDLAQKNAAEAGRKREEADQQRQRAETEKRNAQEQKARAEKNLRERIQGALRASAVVGKNQQLLAPSLKKLRRRLLQAYLNDFEDFVKQRADDPTLRAQQGHVYNEMARITSELGSQETALGYCRDATAIFHELVDWSRKGFSSDPLSAQSAQSAQSSQHLQYRADLAVCYFNRGIIESSLGRTDAAETAYQEALEIQEDLEIRALTPPSSRDAKQALAATLDSLALLYAKDGHLRQAEQTYTRAVNLRDRLARSGLATPADRYCLAATLTNLGDLYRKMQRPTQAETSFNRALGLLQPLVDVDPQDADYRRALAAVHTNRGQLFRNTRRPKEAEADLCTSVENFERLLRDHPGVPVYKSDLVRAYQSLGNLLRATEGRRADAIKAYESARVLSEELVAEKQHKDVSYRYELANLCSNLGSLYTTGGQRDLTLAEKSFARALALLEPLARAHPENVDYQSHLADTYYNRGLLFVATEKDPAQAERNFHNALDVQVPPGPRPP